MQLQYLECNRLHLIQQGHIVFCVGQVEHTWDESFGDDEGVQWSTGSYILQGQYIGRFLIDVSRQFAS